MPVRMESGVSDTSPTSTRPAHYHTRQRHNPTMTIGVAFPDVLSGARAGADWALEALYRDLAPGVLGYFRGQGVPDPEDLASEVFVGIVRNIASFEGDERAFRTWVFSIAHHRLVDHRRRRSRRHELLTDPAELTGPAAADLVGEPEYELEERIPGPAAVAVLNLPPDQRSVVLLRVVADLSVAEVSSILGKSEGAVKALQRRALRRLARELEGEGVS
jgi:RNA polymerase sigma factor (sigma-70 family)